MPFLKRVFDAFKGSDAATSPSSPDGDKRLEFLSVDIDHAAREAQLLVAYVSEAGIEVDETVLRKIVDSKYRSRRGDWDTESEAEFWLALDTMTRAIQPVTMGSLISTKPLVGKGRQRASPAQQAIRRYRVLAILSLVVLLTLQIYWLIGAHTNRQLKLSGEALVELREEIQNIEEAHGTTSGALLDANLESLRAKRGAMVQDMEARSQLLSSWNQIWLFPTGGTLIGKPNEYRSFLHKSDLRQVDTQIKTLTDSLDSDGYKQGIDDPGQQALKKQEIEEELVGLRRAKAALDIQQFNDTELYELAMQRMAATLAVRSLHEYFLPLVYGLLGSAMFVLRRLSEEIRNLTYSADSAVLYGLRITMGALSGLTIGWFLRPDESDLLNILPGLSLSFLVGYNVEVLFSTMDRLISTLSKRPEQKAAKPEKPGD